MPETKIEPVATVVAQKLVQYVCVTTGGAITTTGTLTYTATAFGATVGAFVFSATITPTTTANFIKVDAQVHVANDSLDYISVGLFEDTTSIGFSQLVSINAQQLSPCVISFYGPASTTGAVSYSVRVVGASGTTSVNTRGSAINTKITSVLHIQEVLG